MTMTVRPQPVFRTADVGNVAAAAPRQIECFNAHTPPDGSLARRDSSSLSS